MKRASPRSSVRYQLPSEAYASCSWLKRPMPISRLDAPVSGSISQTHPERSSGSLMDGISSFVRYVFHGVIAAAQRLCRPVVIASTSLTVVPSLSSVRRDTEPQPSESSSPGRCSGTWHLPTSPPKSPGRGCVSSWLFRSHISPLGAWKSTFPSGSSGSGKVTPLLVERAHHSHCRVRVARLQLDDAVRIVDEVCCPKRMGKGHRRDRRARECEHHRERNQKLLTHESASPPINEWLCASSFVSRPRRVPLALSQSILERAAMNPR